MLPLPNRESILVAFHSAAAQLSVDLHSRLKQTLSFVIMAAEMKKNLVLGLQNCILPGILRSTEGIAAIVTTVFGKWVVTTSEFSSNLFICRSTSAYQHHMKPGQSEDGDK